MGFMYKEIVATLIVNLLQHAACSEHILSCNVTELEPCPGKNQRCVQKTNECICDDGYVRFGDDCLLPSAIPTSHSSTAAVVTIFTLALLAVGLILIVRKYNLVEYVRQQINLRRNNDVMYEDVMIGQDDPPLSP